MAELDAGDITDYLTQAGREGALKPWQFRQVVDAIRILYSVVRTEWAARFDWDFWLASARTLGSQHVTTARAVPPVTPAEFAERRFTGDPLVEPEPAYEFDQRVSW